MMQYIFIYIIINKLQNYSEIRRVVIIKVPHKMCLGPGQGEERAK